MTGALVLFQDDDDEEVKALMIVGICVAILLIILIIAAIMVWRLKVYPKTKTHRKLSCHCLYVDVVVVDLKDLLIISWLLCWSHNGQCDFITVSITWSFLLSSWQCQYDSVTVSEVPLSIGLCPKMLMSSRKWHCQCDSVLYSVYIIRSLSLPWQPTVNVILSLSLWFGRWYCHNDNVIFTFNITVSF